VLIHLKVLLLCDAFFIVFAWALDPLRFIVVVLSEGFGVGFTSTFFKSSLALLKVGCVVLGSNNGNNDDESGYDTNEDTLDLMMGVSNNDFWVKERVPYGSKVRCISRNSVLDNGRPKVISTS